MLDQLYADLSLNLDDKGKTKLEVNSHFRNSEVLFVYSRILCYTNLIGIKVVIIC